MNPAKALFLLVAAVLCVLGMLSTVAVAQDPLNPLRNLGVQAGHSMQTNSLDNATLNSPFSSSSDFSKELRTISGASWGIAGAIALGFTIFAIGRYFEAFGGNDPSEEGYSRRSIILLRVLFVCNTLIVMVGIIILFYATSKITKQTDLITSSKATANFSVTILPQNLTSAIDRGNANNLLTKMQQSSATITAFFIDNADLTNLTSTSNFSGLYSDCTIIQNSYLNLLNHESSAASSVSILLNNLKNLTDLVSSNNVTVTSQFAEALNALNTAVMTANLSSVPDFVYRLSPVIGSETLGQAYCKDNDHSENDMRRVIINQLDDVYESKVSDSLFVLELKADSCQSNLSAAIPKLNAYVDQLGNIVSWISQMNQAGATANYVITGFASLLLLATAIGYFFDRHEVMYWVAALLALFAVAYFILLGFWVPVAVTVSATCDQPALFNFSVNNVCPASGTGLLSSLNVQSECSSDALQVSASSIKTQVLTAANLFTVSGFLNSSSYKALQNITDPKLLVQTNSFADVLQNFTALMNTSVYNNASETVVMIDQLIQTLNSSTFSLSNILSNVATAANNVTTSQNDINYLVPNIISDINKFFLGNATSDANELDSLLQDTYSTLPAFMKMVDQCDPSVLSNSVSNYYNNVCGAYLIGVESVWLIQGYLGIFLIPAAIICIFAHKRLGQQRKTKDEIYMDKISKDDPFYEPKGSGF